jgi:hypothetical protein
MTSVTTTGPDRSIWTLEDESRLVQFLLDHHAEAGDGANFKASLWNAAGEELSKHVTKGGPKTAASCKSKWDRVCSHSITIFFSFVLTMLHSSRNHIKRSLFSKTYLDSLGMRRMASLSLLQLNVRGWKLPR